jgi:hypothetical protein
MRLRVDLTSECLDEWVYLGVVLVSGVSFSIQSVYGNNSLGLVAIIFNCTPIIQTKNQLTILHIY